jgi:uncharacterized protein YdeI (YjbR/CyaY-like superfamily)
MMIPCVTRKWKGVAQFGRGLASGGRREDDLSMSRDERIDAYIARQADFARPILERLREVVHDACPETEEAIKWGMPAFLYRKEILAHMAAFKAHAAFGFWRGSLVTGDTASDTNAMGQFGRITSFTHLPPAETIAALVRKAVALADAGVKSPRAKTKSAAKKPVEPPDDLLCALAANPAAAATFERFSPSARRDYVDWVVTAKRPETRAKRIGEAVEWMAEGKKRNWKYENC